MHEAAARWAPGSPALAGAARAISAVLRGRSADEALAPFDSLPERAATRAIALGSLRWYLRLRPAIDALIDARWRKPGTPLHALLVAAAHQVEYSRNVPQVSVHAAVDATRILGEPRASGLVNAVLRRFVSERSALLARLDSDPAIASAHPGWMITALKEAWPEHAAGLIAANNQHPPLTLRVDLSRRSVPEYLEELSRAGLSGHALVWAPAAVQLERPVPVAAIPGFAQGYVAVQDAGAQLAAPLLEARPGMRVLDACAAPGGKTVHLLEQSPGVELLAVDVDEVRVTRIRENLTRSGRDAQLAAMDVRALQSGLDPAPFDRILLDAPCSSTGVIRRHPDIKLLRRATDVAPLAAAQLEILQAAFRLLAPGGRLLYCTCSVLPVENEAVVREFLAAEPAARPRRLPAASELAPGALERSVGVQLLPGGPAGSDGFYYACLEKATAGD
jgi:16S rRNA (cytosine967-C5)-methyltransferase